jgi:2-polyprenyl-3-methyl-5-hydroxy-6-metoxy-1,4-benzoquinol methylase
VSESADALFPERFVPGEMHGLIEAEHLARYHWASSCVRGLRVLDAGCGMGYGSLLLHAAGAASVTGVDISREAVQAAQESAGGAEEIRFLAGDISALPFADGAFDVVVCFEAIEHVQEQARTLDEFHRVLSATGVLIVSSPNREVYQEGNPHHTHEFAPQELREALEERFASVSLERQQAWLMSMVCGDDMLGNADAGHALDVELRKVAGMQPGTETFTLALAGKAELPALHDLAIATDLGELDAWRARSRSAEEHLEYAQQFTADARAAYESAQGNYLAALSALETSQHQHERSEGSLQRASTLLAERNAALRIATAELRHLQAQTASLTTELATSRASLATLTNSRSWRITAPLRALGRALRTRR